ncbi:aldo/keto reductase [Streptomyces sp. MT206]|uniref:aldo/keto reductase n=1 Tax=Streptomyces sp. MT206 TaxID=3031407 RepID=UPI002FC73221
MCLGHALLGNACTALADAARDGLCSAWGVASWDPRSLDMVRVEDLPSPDVLMVRAGFLVGIDLLDATAVLRTAWQVGATWGMSPFGGGHRKVWEDFDPRPFLRPPHDGLSRVQAAFRTAFHLPSASAIAVGTDDPGHLAQLVRALGADVDTAAVSQYLRALHGLRQS